MIDHAQRLARQEAENKRMEEMERESKPLFYTVTLLAVLVVCMFITEYHIMKNEVKNLSYLLATAANQRMIPLGDDAVLECKRTELIK